MTMNTKEVGEIRRRVRRDRSNMTSLYGCYVNENKEIIARFHQSTGIMPENEAEIATTKVCMALSLMALDSFDDAQSHLEQALEYFKSKGIEMVEIGCGGYPVITLCRSLGLQHANINPLLGIPYRTFRWSRCS